MTLAITYRRAMRAIQHDNLDKIPRGEERLLQTGAKLSHERNGRWTLKGYSPDHRDIALYGTAPLHRKWTW